MTWNANGLLQQKENLFVTRDDQKIDVCLISETQFTRESYNIPRRFDLYHTMHPNNGARGGSAVIKKEISPHENIKIEEEEFQVTTVKIKTTSGIITVSAIYYPPRYNLKREDCLNLLRSFSGKFIFGRDFNSKNTILGSRLTNTKVSELCQASKMHKYEEHTTGKPTYWPTDRNKVPGLVGFFMSGNLSRFMDVNEDFDLDSDHSPIVLILSKTIIKKEQNPTVSNKLTDWDMFRENPEKGISLRATLKPKDEIEE